MKILIRYIFLSTIVSLFLFNCSKDDDGEDITPQPENIRLKAYSLNSTEYMVSYNADGKVIDYGNTMDQPGVIIYNSDNKTIQLGSHSFTYNAQGRISKITEPDGNNTKDKQSTLVYNNEGLLANQSSKFTYSFPGGSTKYIDRTFIYNNNKQLMSVTENDQSSTYTRELLNYDSRGNIVQVKKQRSIDGTAFTDELTINYTYDNKKSPGKQLLNNLGVNTNLSLFQLFYFYTMDFGNYALFRTSYYSNNNVISKQYIDNTGSSNSTYTYVYNTQDYPTSVEVHNVNSNGTNSTSYRTWTYETY